jgi:hypothetical protein
MNCTALTRPTEVTTDRRESIPFFAHEHLEDRVTESVPSKL